jgi:hypothetical protein
MGQTAACVAYSTRANTKTSTLPAPPRNSARAAAFAVAPDVAYEHYLSSMRWAIPSAIRNAPCKLTARCARERPTWRGVGLTRARTNGSVGTPH